MPQHYDLYNEQARESDIEAAGRDLYEQAAELISRPHYVTDGRVGTRSMRTEWEIPLTSGLLTLEVEDPQVPDELTSQDRTAPGNNQLVTIVYRGEDQSWARLELYPQTIVIDGNTTKAWRLERPFGRTFGSGMSPEQLLERLGVSSAEELHEQTMSHLPQAAKVIVKRSAEFMRQDNVPTDHGTIQTRATTIALSSTTVKQGQEQQSIRTVSLAQQHGSSIRYALDDSGRMQEYSFTDKDAYTGPSATDTHLLTLERLKKMAALGSETIDYANGFVTGYLRQFDWIQPSAELKNDTDASRAGFLAGEAYNRPFGAQHRTEQSENESHADTMSKQTRQQGRFRRAAAHILRLFRRH